MTDDWWLVTDNWWLITVTDQLYHWLCKERVWIWNTLMQLYSIIHGYGRKSYTAMILHDTDTLLMLFYVSHLGETIVQHRVRNEWTSSQASKLRKLEILLKVNEWPTQRVTNQCRCRANSVAKKEATYFTYKQTKEQEVFADSIRLDFCSSNWKEIQSQIYEANTIWA